MVERLQAILHLILFYILIPILTIYILWQAYIQLNVVFGAIALLYVAISIYLALYEVPYYSKTLNVIRIEEAPIHVTRLLSETTNRGILINQLIIKTLMNKPSGISQTDLYHELPIPADLCPTKEMVRQYIKRLEREGIIRDIAHEVGEAKRRLYILTKRGRWCAKGIRKYYPKYYLSYLLRNILRTRFRKKLPQFYSVPEE